VARLTARPAARPAELDLPATRGGVPLPCRAPGVHPDDWHPVGRDLAADDEYAQALCAGCPVTVECLRYSLDTREPYGVWGGVSEVTRAALLRQSRTRRAEAVA